MKAMNNKSTRINQPKRQPIPYPDMAGKTAWILGAGETLLDVWDWDVPDGCAVITINSSVLWAWKHYDREGKPESVIKTGNSLHHETDYRKPVNYWFARDSVIFNGKKEPENTYRNVALRHPTMSKIIQDKNNVDADYPNVYYMNCIRDWQRCFKIDDAQNSSLMGGNTTLLAALHYTYRCGCRRIVLSGVDLCRIDGARRWMDKRGISNSRHAVGGRTKDTAGKPVTQCGMMVNHMNSVNGMIRHLQQAGVDVFKTSPRGMLAIPYFTDNNTLRLLSENRDIIYKEVSS